MVGNGALFIGRHTFDFPEGLAILQQLQILDTVTATLAQCARKDLPMEDRRFDQLTRSLAHSTNRRDLMRRLLGVGIAAGGAVALNADQAGAARRGYSGPPPPQPEPCRAAGTFCAANAQCCTNFCAPNSGPGGTCDICDATICGDFACVDTKWDPRNCGACGNECNFAASCNNGVCQGDWDV